MTKWTFNYLERQGAQNVLLHILVKLSVILEKIKIFINKLLKYLNKSEFKLIIELLKHYINNGFGLAIKVKRQNF